ncbi:MAG: ABC transporter permease, partial [Candidatus Bipolaricaulota bacterium]
MRAPSWLQIERRPTPPPWVVFLVSIGAIAAALLAAGIFFQAYGVSMVRAYHSIFRGAFGSTYGFAETIRRMIPLLAIGVGLSVAFRALFWNIGAEGQMLVGAVAAAGIA